MFVYLCLIEPAEASDVSSDGKIQIIFFGMESSILDPNKPCQSRQKYGRLPQPFRSRYRDYDTT